MTQLVEQVLLLTSNHLQVGRVIAFLWLIKSIIAKHYGIEMRPNISKMSSLCLCLHINPTMLRALDRDVN